MRRAAPFVAGLALAARLAGAAAASEAAAPENGAPAGENGAAAAPSTWSDQIVVTASRDERPLGQVPLHARVLDPLAASESLGLDAADVVARQVPSFNPFLAASTLVAEPRHQSLHFRGASSGAISHALLLVDGLPALDLYSAAAIWSRTPKLFVERIEVIPGGGATVWGNLALAGVVNLITRSPTARSLEVEGRLAERSTLGLTAIYSDLGGRWAGNLAADHFTTGGFRTVEAASRGPVDEPEYRDYDSLNGRASATLSPGAALHLRLLGYRERRGEGSALDRAENDEWMPSATLDVVAASGATWRAQLFGRRLRFSDESAEPDAGRTTNRPSADIYDLASDGFGGGVVWSRPLGGAATLTAGADAQWLAIDRGEDLEYDGERFTRRSEVSGEQQLAGGFVEGSWRRERWSAQASLRFDSLRTSDGRTARTDLVTGATLEAQQLVANTESTVHPNLGVVFQATAASRLRAAVYSGFRGPTPSELFVGQAPRAGRVTLPNPALEPETLVGVEAGYDFAPSSRVALRLTGFWSETDDLIERITLGRVGPGGGVVAPCGPLGPNGACIQRHNLGTTRARGVELGGELRPHPRWRLTLEAALLDSEVVDNPAAPRLVGHELEQTPGERAALGLLWSGSGGLAAALRVRYTGDSWAEIENEHALPAFTVLDLTVSRPLGPALDLFAGVDNLLDERPRIDFSTDDTYRVGAPRIVQVGARWRPALGWCGA